MVLGGSLHVEGTCTVKSPTPLPLAMIALLLGMMAVTVGAEELPADRRVPLRLAPSGLPAALQGFVPTTRHIVPIESGCGMLEAHAPDGRDAVIVFDPGTADEWGQVLLYIISDPDGVVVEWAGDPDPSPCVAKS